MLDPKPEDVERISEWITQYQKDYQALHGQLDELVRKHPYKFAAMHKGKLTIANSMDELVEVLGNDSPYTAAVYLNPAPKKMILFQIKGFR